MSVLSTSRRAGLLLGGLLIGVLVTVIGLWLWLRIGQERVRLTVMERLDLPAEVLQVEGLPTAGSARIALRDVALLGVAGDTIAAVPLLQLRLAPTSLAADGTLVISEATLRRPFLNLVQLPDSGFNIQQVLRVEAGGREVQVDQPEGGRTIVIRNVRVVGGRVRLATRWQPDDAPSSTPASEAPRLAQIRGEPYRIRTFRNVDARLPSVRIGGPRGWRVEVADLDARLAEPDVRIRELRGTLEQIRPDGVRFTIDVLRTGDSRLEGAGVVRFADSGAQVDARLRANPLDFADLRVVLPDLAAEGRAVGSVVLASRPGGRTAVAAQDLVLTSGASRVTGRVSALVGGSQPLAFWDTDLRLEPLRLETVAQLGLVDRLPLNGSVRGSVTSAGGTAGVGAGALRLDLVATAVPEDLPSDSSTLLVQGPIEFTAGEAPFRFAGVRVVLQPLRLAALRPFVAPEQQERLQGMLQGDVIVTGTPSALQIGEGALSYEVANAPPTRLTNVSLQLTREPELRFALAAEAQPLALGTVAELFPGLPFREAQLTGPIRIESGAGDAVRLAADLRGEAGGVAVQGTVTPGEPLRFDIAGQLDQLRPAALLAGTTPDASAVSGSFTARGTPDDIALGLNLTQGAAGRFAFDARVRRAGGELQLDAGGDVADFRVGSLIGRPGLFASPMSGRIQLGGGGRQPYRFRFDLAGAEAALDLTGSFRGGEIPEYSATGTFRGMDASLLPGAASLPRTDLNAAVDLRGRGTTLETLAARLSLVTDSSTLAGLPLAARVNAAVRGGVLLVDTLYARVQNSTLSAEGSWGLTRPAPGLLRYRLSAPDLAQLSALLAPVTESSPIVGGAVAAEGWLAGSLRRPTIATSLRGRGIQYREWLVRELTLSGTGTRIEESWDGDLTLAATGAELPGGRSFQAVQLAARGGPAGVAYGLSVRQDAATDLSSSGVVQFTDGVPRAVSLASLVVRGQGTEWQLANAAQLRWGGVEGLAISGFQLQRAGAPTDFLILDGWLPPRGQADFRIRARGLNVGRLLGAVLPDPPDIAGVFALDGTIEGPVTDPEARIELRVDSLRIRGTEAQVALLSARYADGVLVVDSAAIQVGGRRALAANATIPARLSIEGFLPGFELVKPGQLRAEIVADSLPAGLLTVPFPEYRDVVGAVDGRVSVGGTVNSPRLAGQLALRDGAVTIDALDTRFRAVAGRFVLDGNAIRIDTLVARNRGTAAVAGTIRFNQATPELYLTARLNDFLAISREGIADIQATGQVALTGTYPTPTLTGRVRLSNGDITIPGIDEDLPELEIANIDIGAIGADTISRVTATPSLVEQIRIQNLDVEIGDAVWLVADDARVQIAGQLGVSRAGQELRIFGQLQALRGTYALKIGPLIREFDVVDGTVEFFGTPDFNPAVAITAENEVRTLSGAGPGTTLTVLANITGTLQFPRLELTTATQPPLPESEILSYLVFGRPSFQLAEVGGEFAQQLIAQDLIGGVISARLEQTLAGLGLGVDYIRVRGRPELAADPFAARSLGGFGSTGIEVGKQLGDDWFWTVETGVSSIFSGRPTLGTSLQWQIDNEWAWRFALEPVRRSSFLFFNTTTGDRYQFSTDLRRRWEYGLPREESSLFREAPRLPGRLAPPPAEPADSLPADSLPADSIGSEPSTPAAPR